MKKSILVLLIVMLITSNTTIGFAATKATDEFEKNVLIENHIQNLLSGSKSPDKTITSPQKGKAYEYLTNQQSYVEVPPGSNSGRMHYTLKRTVSSYTTTGYIAFDWGDWFS